MHTHWNAEGLYFSAFLYQQCNNIMRMRITVTRMRMMMSARVSNKLIAISGQETLSTNTKVGPC